MIRFSNLDSFFAIFFVFFVPIAIFLFFDEESKKIPIIIYQTVTEFGIVFTLVTFCFSYWDLAKKTIVPYLLISFFCFFIAEFGFNTTFLQSSLSAYRNKAFCAICYTLTFAWMIFAFIKYFDIFHQKLWIWLSILFISLVHFLLQYQFLLIPLEKSYFSKLPHFMFVNGVAYSVCTALTAGIAIVYCLRSLDTKECLFLHILVATLMFDFAARYQLVQGEFDQMNVGQFFWAISVGALFLVVFLSSRYGSFVFAKPASLVNGSSVRYNLALFVFLMMAIMLSFLLLMKVVVIKNAIDVSILLILLFFCWSISNIIGLRVHDRFLQIGFLMKKNQIDDIHEDGSPDVFFHKIKQSVSYASEVDFIISQYNKVIEKLNLRGKKLIESVNHKIYLEKEALQGKIAKQIAHDIASPLGALRVMMHLSESYTDLARETLWTAITSISDIVGRLSHDGSSFLNQEIEVYSVFGTIEKIINIKKVEFSHLNVSLKIRFHQEIYKSFIQVHLDEFRSALSNIINNSKDEIIKKNTTGTIAIDVSENKNSIVIAISDDGSDVSEERIRNLNEGIFVSTKHANQPLGIHGCRESLRKVHGNLVFSRIEPIGLKATIFLPLQMIPEWIISELHLHDAHFFVVFDDDHSVHQMMKLRLSQDPSFFNIEYVACQTEESFDYFLENHEQEKSFFLIDYEFRGKNKNGIEIIKKRNRIDHSVLMTSHWDEISVIEECKLSKLRLLPKNLAYNVPMFIGDKIHYDFLLIEDNPIVRESWRIAADSLGLKYKIFSDPVYFQMHQKDFKSDVLLFLDFYYKNTNLLNFFPEL